MVRGSLDGGGRRRVCAAPSGVVFVRGVCLLRLVLRDVAYVELGLCRCWLGSWVYVRPPLGRRGPLSDPAPRDVPCRPVASFPPLTQPLVRGRGLGPYPCRLSPFLCGVAGAVSAAAAGLTWPSASLLEPLPPAPASGSAPRLACDPGPRARARLWGVRASPASPYASRRLRPRFGWRALWARRGCRLPPRGAPHRPPDAARRAGRGSGGQGREGGERGLVGGGGGGACWGGGRGRYAGRVVVF
jgi:hypothetical protein